MPEERPLISFVAVKLNGQDAPVEVMNDLIEVVVDESLHLPTMFALRLHNPAMRWLESEALREGVEVEIGVPPRANAEPRPICRGRIAAIEPDLSEQMPVVTFRGYDLGLALFRGRQSRSFVQMTDSDIVRRVARDAGLEVQSDETREVHEYVFQANQSNMEFLRDRARRNGYEVFLDGRTLHFRRPPSGEQAIELRWGMTLKTFTPRLSTAEPVDDVVVRSWDPRRKQKIVARATRGESAPQIGEQRPAGQVAHHAWDRPASLVVVDQPVATQQEADDLARSLMEEAVGSFVEAEGTCNGRSDLRAGKTVRIAGLGPRFEGQYYVTAATHAFQRERGHLVSFSISGRRPSAGQRALAGSPRDPAHRLTGVVVGIVTNNQDPDGLGRVKVRFPWLADDEESHWARIAAPMAGAGRGFYYLPEIEDEVLVAFEHGDIHRPYIVGALWNGSDHPPKPNREVVAPDGKVKQRILKSRTGHVITLDDSDEAPAITIVDQTGANKIVMDSRGASITISAAREVTVDAPSIKLGRVATLTLANELLVDAFNSHMHYVGGPPPMGSPTTPPFPPAIKGTVTTIMTKGS